MPLKPKKKRVVAKFSVEADASDFEPVVEAPSVRQVVEVVEEEPQASEALETIKEDAKEIADAVESIEQEVEADTSAPEQSDEQLATEDDDSSMGTVKSLFNSPETSVGPEITVVGKRDTSLGVWVGAMLGIALAVGVSLVVLVRGPQTFTSIMKKPEPTPTVTVAPTAAPAVSLAREDVHVKVLNGGGTPGAGSKMKAFLEAKGYVVDAVGNTEQYSYETTDVVVKSGKESIAKLLADDLKAEYSLGSSSATLDSAATYDAEVIVGKE